MISAMSDNIVISADKIDAIADEIDLSGNDSVSITSTNQISASVANNLDLTSNSSITLLEGLIGLIVENEDTSSAIELTSGMISAMSENIVIAASKINAIADEINLESNGSVQTVVNTTLTDELDDEEIQAAIVQTVTASAAFDDYKTEVSTMVSQTADDLSVLIAIQTIELMVLIKTLLGLSLLRMVLALAKKVVGIQLLQTEMVFISIK